MVKRKKATELRSRILGVKVSKAEYEWLVEAAGPYPVSTWARGVLLDDRSKLMKAAVNAAVQALRVAEKARRLSDKAAAKGAK